MEMREGGLDDPQLAALLAHHARTARAETGRGSAHALDSDALATPDIRVWSLWEDGRPIATGALRRLSASEGEVKAMHVAEAARRRGLGRLVLDRIVAEARAAGLARISLETGSWPYFTASRAFYRAAGFTTCEPFGDYRPDPNSVFMTLPLDRPSATA